MPKLPKYSWWGRRRYHEGNGGAGVAARNNIHTRRESSIEQFNVSPAEILNIDAAFLSP